MKKLYFPLFVLFLLITISLPIIFPYFHKGYFPTHDGEWAVVRLGDMFRTLRDHQFPVRYSGNLNLGYGYPLFNFTYPAPYYLGVLFHFFKFGFVDIIKLLFGLSVILSAIAMYFASKEIWQNRIAGIISAIFYVYLPYRIVDLYARGSVGESLSFILFPVILFFIVKMLKNSSKFYLVLASLCYALLITTHNIMALLFTPVLIIFILTKIYFEKLKSYFLVVSFMLLGFGLSAFFWLPALVEKHYILLSQIPIANRSIYFVQLSQLFFPKWGYGLPDRPDGFSYQIGIPQIAVLLIVILVLLYAWFKRKALFNNSLKLAAVLGTMTIVLIILMFSFTAPIWQTTPLLKEINYPWTLLAPVGFLLGLLAGFLWLQNRLIKSVLIGLTFMTIVLVLPHAKPALYIDKGDGYYLTNEATTTSSQELMPLWVKTQPVKHFVNKVEIVRGKGTIQNLVFNSYMITFTGNFQSKSMVRINTIYYPGWIIKVDGKRVPISYNNDYGVMEFAINPGQHIIKGSFSETPIRLASDIISIASLLLVISLFFVRKEKAL